MNNTYEFSGFEKPVHDRSARCSGPAQDEYSLFRGVAHGSRMFMIDVDE